MTPIAHIKSTRHNTEIQVYASPDSVTLLLAEEGNTSGLKLVLDASNIHELIEALEVAASQIEPKKGEGMNDERTLTVDAALGGVYDRIGEYLGQEDASGARRHCVGLLRNGQFEDVAKWFKVDIEVITKEFGHLRGKK